MFVDKKSKKYLTKLLDDTNILDAIDSKNWDTVYEYFLHLLREDPSFHGDEFIVRSDLTRLLLESGVNPLAGRKHISGYTFYGKYNLEDIPAIPNSVEELDSAAYIEVVTHEPMELIIPGSVEVIGINAIMECNDITRVIIEDGVKEIKQYAIAFCENLEYVEIPNSLTELGYLIEVRNKSSSYEYDKIVIKFNGSSDEFIDLLQAQVSSNLYWHIFEYFRKFKVLDKNNNRIRL